MKKIILICSFVVVIAIIISSVGSCSVCTNPTHSKYFTEDGTAVLDSASAKDSFRIENPSSVHFFMESSGSMNGFLRGGVPTDFKSDLWEIINYYSNLVSAVSVLSSDGGSTKSVDLPVAQFQNPLNGGGFLSAQSTNLCEMLDSVIHNIDASKNEVAVFVSDMEYDPVGAVAPNVLQSVYSTDVATLLSNFGYSASLVAAKSNSVNKEGTSVVSGRPYYYLILGKPECVADTRNKISYLLNSKVLLQFS